MTQVNTILLIVNLILSAISPLITSLSHVISNFKKSNCCGGTIEVDKDIELEKKNSIDAIKEQTKNELKELRKLSKDAKFIIKNNINSNNI